MFPLSEVADVPAAAHISCPCFGGEHYRVVQAHRKEHWLLFTILFLTGGHHLALDPGALDCVSRENEDELVVETDGFIDALVVVVANLEVFRSEPAAHTLALQISIEPLGKDLVLARVADETRVEVNGFANKRAHIS